MPPRSEVSRYDLLARADAALRGTEDTDVRWGITLLRDALKLGTLYHNNEEIARAAEGLIVLCRDPQVRLGIAVLAHMLGATVSPTPFFCIEPEQPQRLALAYDAVVMIAAGPEVGQ